MHESEARLPRTAARLCVVSKTFALTAHGTTVGPKCWPALTTFLTMAYIIFVQPAVLGAAGMDFGAVLTATCLSTALARS